MNNPLILTFDVGTQSTRAMLVNKKGDIVDCKQIKYEEPYFSKDIDFAEQKPSFYYECMADVSKKLIKANPKLVKNIKAVTLTVIRDTVLCLDENNKPLRDVIIWLDKREASNDIKFGFFKGLAFRLTNTYEVVKAQTKQSICNWIMEHEPLIWEKTNKYVMLPTYLNYLLTDNLIDSDANQIGHMPFDFKNKCWAKEGGLTRFMFDVPMSKLCDLCKPGDTIGTITKKAHKDTLIPEGLPLIATGSDKGCETLGLSVIDMTKAAVSFGTTTTVQLMTDKYFEPQTNCPSYPAVKKDAWNPEIQIYSGFWMVTWFIKQFCKEEELLAKKRKSVTEAVLQDALREVPPGANGLVLQPYWTPGVSNPMAKGAIIGFNESITKKHIYRAIIEGLDFELYRGLKKMEKRGHTQIKEIRVGGGGSRGDEICQTLSDVMGLPVRRIQTHETCGIGASMIAFVALNEFNDLEEACSSMVRIKDEFMPNSKNHELYMKIYDDVYSKMYKPLEPLYIKIRKIMKGNR